MRQSPPSRSLRSLVGPAAPSPLPSLVLALFFSLAALGCVEGPVGPQGPQGPEGPRGPGPAEAALTGVTPSRLFTGRTTTVVVSGANTAFDEGWTVDLPLTGTTTRQIGVASSGALIAELTIPTTAPLGRHEITASSKATGLVLEGGIELVSPISSTLSGPLFQGSVVALRLAVLDPTTPIGPGAGLGSAPDVLEPLGWTFRMTSDLQLAGLVLLRADAPAGQVGLLLDRTGDLVPDDILPDAFLLGEAEPGALTADRPTAGVVSNEAPSRYRFELEQDDLLTVALTNVGAQLDPRLLVIGPGGGAADVVGVGGTSATAVARFPGTHEIVVYDAAGAPGASAGFTLSGAREPAHRTMETEPNDTLGDASPVGISIPVALEASLQSPSDVDLYRITLEEPAALLIETVPGERGEVVDTTLEVIGVSQPTGEAAANDDAEVGRTPFSRVQTTRLDPGTYVIVVRLARGAPGRYGLVVRFAP